MIYGTVCDYCTDTSCPTMSGGPKFEYLWADKDRYKKPTQLPAPQYVSLLMDWIEAQINNENLFPVSTGIIYFFYYTYLNVLMFKFVIRCTVSKNFYATLQKNTYSII